jgi:hypothetical protein
VIGIASAYVSPSGVDGFSKLIRAGEKPQVRLVAGLDGFVTSPTALEMAIDRGWDLRLASAQRPAIFHPKMVVGGAAFTARGGIDKASCLYMGSANLTRSGLNENVECGLFSTTPNEARSGSDAFSIFWRSGRRASRSVIDRYATLFARHNRARQPFDLDILGIGDGEGSGEAFSHEHACVAWAGLESFTGDYVLQVEFPRKAGRVLKGIADRLGSPAKLPTMCVDGKARPMMYRYYEQNGMFRLNIPNDVPGVRWARDHHAGVAVVGMSSPHANSLQLEIVRPGILMHEVISRSRSLGTLGRTSTRLYGWY